MAAVYTENPANWGELEPYVERNLVDDIFVRQKCFFYDTCSFRYHANMDGKAVKSLLAYIKDRDGIIIITRCILMELTSRSGSLNPEYIQYCKNIRESGIDLYVIYEEELFDIMRVCFGTNAAVNEFLTWAVRMLKGPVSTITKTLNDDKSLYDEVIKGKNQDNNGIYKRFFSAVRANKEPQDNLGEEVLAVCLHILSMLPGEEEGKFCILTDDKGAAGKIDTLFKKTNRQFLGKRIVLLSTPRLAWILYDEGYIEDKNTLKVILGAGSNGTIRVLGTRIFDLKSIEITLAVAEIAELMIQKGIHITF